MLLPRLSSTLTSHQSVVVRVIQSPLSHKIAYTLRYISLARKRDGCWPCTDSKCLFGELRIDLWKREFTSKKLGDGYLDENKTQLSDLKIGRKLEIDLRRARWGKLDPKRKHWKCQDWKQWRESHKDSKKEDQNKSKDNPRFLPRNPLNLHLISAFYRQFITQDHDKIWPIYLALHNHGLTYLLSRRIYRSLFLLTSRLPPTESNLGKMLIILEDIKTRFKILRKTEYNSLMHWVAGATAPRPMRRHMSSAQAVMEMMRSGGVLLEPPSALSQLSGDPRRRHRQIMPSRVTLNTLIGVAIRVADLHSAQQIYNRMIASNDTSPDAITFTILIQWFAQNGDLQSMEEMILRMLNTGISMTSITWNSVMLGYVRTGEWRRALSMFGEAVEAADRSDNNNGKNSKAPPADACTYATMIEALSGAGMPRKAFMLLEEMEVRDFRPNIEDFNKLFRSFMGGKWALKDAHREEEEEQLNLLISPISQNGINASTRAIDILHLLLARLKHLNLRINHTTINTLIPALLDHGDEEGALRAYVELNEMLKKRPCHGRKTHKPSEELLVRIQQALENIRIAKLEVSVKEKEIMTAV